MNIVTDTFPRETDRSRGQLKAAAPYLIEQDYAAYTPEKVSVWSELVARRLPDLTAHACREYLEGYEIIGTRAAPFPHLKDVSARPEPIPGWNATAVSGFLPAEAFFEMLAARKFPTTTWLRERESLEYTPEPDIFHDVFGHVPMHSHLIFANFLQHYGEVCARMEDKEVLEKLGRLFWYTGEFGLIHQNGALKVYGSGLISSHGECRNVMQGGCATGTFCSDEVCTPS